MLRRYNSFHKQSYTTFLKDFIKLLTFRWTLNFLSIFEKKIMKLSNSLIFTLSSVSAGSYWEPWTRDSGYYWGEYLTCKSNDFITGTCSSGRKRHCESSLGSDASHAIKCETPPKSDFCDSPKIKVTNQCRTLYGEFG